MIRVTGIRLPVEHGPDALSRAVCRRLGVGKEEIGHLRVLRRGIDARDRGDIRYSYTVAVQVEREKRVLSKNKNPNVTHYEESDYRFPAQGSGGDRPLIIGSGPAGLFCAYELAVNGFCPVVLERGEAVEERVKTVENFWKSGVLDPESNVQFGEGGAGTFSDGKLATGVKDRDGRITEIMRVFVENGAPEDILADAQPHLGTDLLTSIVRRMRERIIRCGGEVFFSARAKELLVRDGAVRGVRTADGREFSSGRVALAIGHSARDTVSALYAAGLAMEAKPFAVGLRIEHPQALINAAQYGPDAPEHLGAAAYKCAARAPSGRGVYTFCMCPGGYVVNASSEMGHLAVNGMSYSGRAGQNANSAVVVTVGPQDYAGLRTPDMPEALAGIAFQRMLEKRAFEAAAGAVPVQRFEDFAKGEGGGIGGLRPQIKGAYEAARADGLLPAHIKEDLCFGIRDFGRRVKGFDMADALLSGVESRTSSPVRILRDGEMQASLRGLYPCGEGAGFAGGIVSAAADGIRVAEKIALHLKI